MNKNFKRVISFIGIVSMLMCVLTGCIQDNRAVVTVNGEGVTQAEFAYYHEMVKQQMLMEANVQTQEDADKFWQTEIDGADPIETAREKAKDEIVAFKLQHAKAVEMGIELTDEEKNQTREYLAQIVESAGGKSAYEAQLDDIGTDQATFEKLYEESMLVSKLVTKLEEDKVLTVTEEEVSDYIKKNYIKAKHILFATQDLETGAQYDSDMIGLVYNTATNVLERIADGENFDELMNTYSEDTGLAENPDGYVFTKGEMVQAFEEAAFALKENEVSDIVATDYGYHIIKRLPFTVTEETVTQYTQASETKILEEKFASYTEEMKEKASIKVNKGLLRKFK